MIRWRGGKRLATIGLGLALAWGSLAQVAPAANPRVQTLYSKERAFRLPFNMEAADRPRTRQIQLWASSDGGEWQKVDAKDPDAQAFFFRAPKDGEYWFAVRTLDTKNRLIPSDVDEVEPNMKVIVDTTVPAMNLDALPRRGSVAAVRWEVVDDHIDLESLRLEFKVEGGDWTPVPIRKPARIGQEKWDCGTSEPIKVRLNVADRAKNLRMLTLDLPDGSSSAGAMNGPGQGLEGDVPPPRSTFASSENERESPRPISANPPAMTPARTTQPVGQFNPFAPAESGAAGGGAPAPEGPAPPILVTNPKFGLQYLVEDPGPNGPAVVELWVTTDGGRTWYSRGEDPDRQSPFPVDLGGEGTFGLKLVARSSANQGDQPPVPGEPPETIVEVDSSGPAIKLDPPRITGGQITIAWHANDPHPAPRSVMISVRPDEPDAKWVPITPAPIDNSGQYVWALPANSPPKIHFRVDIVDSLGNRGFAETTETGAVLVDRSRPKGRIIGLDPSTREGTGPSARAFK
ncbi:hypothetical protein P12x_005173 [Tundrisphaera lichenicola]|uniref:hypothetical protein n=1 Tax=Tundrisphaera lichenicola TaxID=2029860 RepID=UPI003EBAFDC9